MTKITQDFINAHFYGINNATPAMQERVGKAMLQQAIAEGHSKRLPNTPGTPGDITRNILSALFRHGKLTRGRLKKVANTYGDNASAHLNHLEKQGLVVSEGEKMHFVYSLTDKGREYMFGKMSAKFAAE